jgi:hypothetical protein
MDVTNMAWGKINNLEINAPSGFSSEDVVIGGFNTTLLGTKRRYIKAVKKVWKISYDLLPVADYDLLYAEFEKEIPTTLQESQTYATFTVYEGTLAINNENVHMDISARNFIAGTDYLSSVEIVLTQV